MPKANWSIFRMRKSERALKVKYQILLYLILVENSLLISGGLMAGDVFKKIIVNLKQN